MLYTIAVVLVILWLLGLVTSYTMGGLVHVLLVIAIVVVLLRVISGRRPLLAAVAAHPRIDGARGQHDQGCCIGTPGRRHTAHHFRRD